MRERELLRRLEEIAKSEYVSKLLKLYDSAASVIDNDIREIINKGRLKYDKCRDLLRKAKRSNKVNNFGLCVLCTSFLAQN